MPLTDVVAQTVVVRVPCDRWLGWAAGGAVPIATGANRDLLDIAKDAISEGEDREIEARWIIAEVVPWPTAIDVLLQCWRSKYVPSLGAYFAHRARTATRQAIANLIANNGKVPMTRQAVAWIAAETRALLNSASEPDERWRISPVAGINLDWQAPEIAVSYTQGNRQSTAQFTIS